MRRSNIIPFGSVLAVSAIFGGLTGCKKALPPPVEERKKEISEDVPVMGAMNPGHRWVYRITLENPEDTRTGSPLKASFERSRTYVGKVDPGNGESATDCFEVNAKDAMTLREFVTISDEAVHVKGQANVDKDGKQINLVWLQSPIPFFRAGLTAGDSMPLAVFNKQEDLWRVTRVIGREKVTVPAGDFQAVRLQMFGKDGEISLRKTYWFAPKVGLVKEEKVREVGGKPVFSEVEELIRIEPAQEQP